MNLSLVNNVEPPLYFIDFQYFTSSDQFLEALSYFF